MSLDYDDNGASMSSETRSVVEAEVKKLLQVRALAAWAALPSTAIHVARSASSKLMPAVLSETVAVTASLVFLA